MKYFKWAGVGALLLSAVIARAQVPPAEQLLPRDTYGVITVPDFQKLTTFYQESPAGDFWRDPAMKPFREKLTTEFKEELVAPLEKELGVKLSDYRDLLQGQLTLAVTPVPEGSEDDFFILLLVDAKDESEALSAHLKDFRTRWRESGKELRSETIRGVEFTQITINDIEEMLERAFPSQAEDAEGDEEAEANEPMRLYIGQSKSLFIASEDPKAIEKVLARQNGGEIPPLAEEPAFQLSQNRLFRNSYGYAWLNFSPIYQAMLTALAEQPQPEAEPGMPAFNPAKILPALGLAGLKSISASFTGNEQGTSLEAFVSVPEAEREGIFRIFSLENKPSGPPAFVPADAVQFQRVRLDVGKAWTALETMLNNIDPGMVGMLQIMFGAVESAGQQQDPNFTFKENFIGNLGDDFIVYQKAPRGEDAAAVVAAPSLFLIGSPNPPQLAEAMRFVMMLAPIEGPPEEREFIGKKIYSITTGVPAAEGEDGPVEGTGVSQTLSFAASGDYVALSTDATILEEYLRSAGTPARPLREFPGLTQAAQKIGGLDTGFFTFENQKASYGTLWNLVKNDPETFGQGLMMFLPGGRSDVEGDGMKDWLDFSLLPDFEAISKYFGIAVMTGSTTPEGYTLRAFGPTPAGLR